MKLKEAHMSDFPAESKYSRTIDHLRWVPQQQDGILTDEFVENGYHQTSESGCYITPVHYSMDEDSQKSQDYWINFIS